MVMPFNKERHENVAEHSFMLAPLSCALAKELDGSLDLGIVAQFALAHDIVEVYTGDTTVWASKKELEAKYTKEMSSLRRIAHEQQAFPWIARTVETYERRDTPEARFVYALDKILAHALVILGDHHPVHPTREAYQKSEEIARQKVTTFPALSPYFDDMCQTFANSPHFFSDGE